MGLDICKAQVIELGVQPVRYCSDSAGTPARLQGSDKVVVAKGEPIHLGSVQRSPKRVALCQQFDFRPSLHCCKRVSREEPEAGNLHVVPSFIGGEVGTRDIDVEKIGAAGEL
jgi:hypothetical protein